mmetsp:Transcript_34989/g.97676  ORF Transcript_34989/g.97676 Transcript_34989/m.97676 type:complete len:291 (+) Transcript_34989:96-968(+)
MIDAYEVLGLGLDANEDDVKKAFRRKSLQYHPDKVQASGAPSDAREVNARFNEIQEARDILSNADRKQMYDTFGVDIGDKSPEIEVWSIGFENLLSPMGMLTLQTAGLRLCLWLAGFTWIFRLVIFAGLVVAGLYAAGVTIQQVSLRSEEALPILIRVAVVEVLVVVHWLLPLIADTLGLLYLVAAVVSLDPTSQSWKVCAGVAVVCLFVSWLLSGRWHWVVGFEVVLCLIVLLSLTVATGMMRMWIDNMRTQHGDKLRQWRTDMRSQRQVLEDEVARLRKRLEDATGKR